MVNTLPLDKVSVDEDSGDGIVLGRFTPEDGGVSSPSWHEDVLAERDAMHQRGDDEFEDWDAAKRNIRNKLS